MSQRIGILLGQLGTPDAPTTAAVRRYLAEFLSDHRVVDLNPILWKLVLHGVILRVRPSKSAALYQKVWTDDGSPLLVISNAQAKGLEEGLNAKGAEVRVEVAMRYGNPSTGSAIDKLTEWGAERILLFPMYPQYAAPTTGSTCDKVFSEFQKRRAVPTLRVVPPYYDHPLYIDALAASVNETMEGLSEKPDKTVVSFHGIPQRYAVMGDPYPDHCQATMDALAAKMDWSNDDFVMTYQSRFGREEWLQPYTDHTLIQLGKDGRKSLVAMCPGFTADCLETVDEIGNLGEEQFQSGGGEKINLVPCLNDSPRWIDAMVEIAAHELQGWV